MAALRRFLTINHRSIAENRLKRASQARSLVAWIVSTTHDCTVHTQGAHHMPRKNQFNVVSIVPNKHPEPPTKLTVDEQREWNAIVQAMPHDIITPANFPLLVVLVRHIVIADMLDAELKKRRTIDDRFIKIAAECREESKLIASLSGKLCLTPRSRWGANKAARMANKPVSRPWDDDDA